ncbi:MAG TPA: ribose 5-phosphate isomerase B [Candidatus Brocadiia bacterium]|nr:ribose 5-phosphate isomerase B [Candidatus Brocadiia bacterium]
MKVAFGCDHRGFAYRNEALSALKSLGVEIYDCGISEKVESADYPDIAHEAASSVSRGECGLGILICGSGIGMSLAANKVKGIRAAVCWNEKSAELARRHNHANVLCLGRDFLHPEQVGAIIAAWLGAEEEGGRHQRRVDRISEIERGPDGVCGCK